MCANAVPPANPSEIRYNEGQRFDRCWRDTLPHEVKPFKRRLNGAAPVVGIHERSPCAAFHCSSRAGRPTPPRHRAGTQHSGPMPGRWRPSAQLPVNAQSKLCGFGYWQVLRAEGRRLAASGPFATPNRTSPSAHGAVHRISKTVRRLPLGSAVRLQGTGHRQILRNDARAHFLTG